MKKISAYLFNDVIVSGFSKEGAMKAFAKEHTNWGLDPEDGSILSNKDLKGIIGVRAAKELLLNSGEFIYMPDCAEPLEFKGRVFWPPGGPSRDPRTGRYLAYPDVSRSGKPMFIKAKKFIKAHPEVLGKLGRGIAMSSIEATSDGKEVPYLLKERVYGHQVLREEIEPLVLDITKGDKNLTGYVLEVLDYEYLP